MNLMLNAGFFLLLLIILSICPEFRYFQRSAEEIIYFYFRDKCTMMPEKRRKNICYMFLVLQPPHPCLQHLKNIDNYQRINIWILNTVSWIYNLYTQCICIQWGLPILDKFFVVLEIEPRNSLMLRQTLYHWTKDQIKFL